MATCWLPFGPQKRRSPRFASLAGTWVPRWRFFLGSFIGLPAGLLILAALALPGNVEAAAVAAALGFAGGAIAARLGINVWVVRALLLASFLLPVLGVGAYALVWVLTPWQDGSIPLERALRG